MAKIKKRYIFLAIISFIIIFYAVGPRPEKVKLDTNLPTVTNNLDLLELTIKKSESITPGIKPDNEARIIWFDSLKKQKTKYSVVYLHGFSASQGEGDPIHLEFAKRYGCNLYLSRLEEHGIDNNEIFFHLTAEKLLSSAKKAIAIGKQLGDSLIVIATSNGGAMALYIAFGHPEIKGLIIYSPLIDFFDPATKLLDKPWGLQIARKVTGGESFQGLDSSTINKRYWTTRYRLEGAVALKNMIDEITETSVYEKIKIPVFLGYYYKDEEHQDKVVSVKAMLEMYDHLGTKEPYKRKFAFVNVGHHVIASKYKSLDLNSVRRETFKFAEEVLKLKPAK